MKKELFMFTAALFMSYNVFSQKNDLKDLALDISQTAKEISVVPKNNSVKVLGMGDTLYHTAIPLRNYTVGVQFKDYYGSQTDTLELWIHERNNQNINVLTTILRDVGIDGVVDGVDINKNIINPQETYESFLNLIKPTADMLKEYFQQ